MTKKQKDGARSIVVSPVAMIGCPTRRTGLVFAKPADGTYMAINASKNPDGANVAGRGDYAINCGDAPHNEFDRGPAGMFESIVARHRHVTKTGKLLKGYQLSQEQRIRKKGEMLLTGISFEQSQIKFKDITDGTKGTYLLGERYIHVERYEDGQDGADNETWCTGYNNDNFRNGYYPPRWISLGPPRAFPTP